MIELRWLLIPKDEAQQDDAVVFSGPGFMRLQYRERIDTDADGQPIYTDWKSVLLGGDAE